MSPGRLFLLLVWLGSFILTNAQEVLVPLPGNSQLHYASPKSLTNLRVTALELPFADDFNQTDPFPDALKWEDNFVYINNSFPIDPPSLGVATFDGLNPKGQPYADNVGAVGIADVLTSLPINLSGLREQDSIYLSFYWQNGGRGDRPEISADFFFVEFLNNEGQWVEVLRIPPPAQVIDFRQEFIKLTPAYLHDTFRFKFGAVGSLYGSVDHWHIDYVKLDRNRNPSTEATVSDMAFVQGPVRYFKDYYQLPYRHFTRDMLADSNTVRVKNNFRNTVDIVDNYLAVELGSGDVLDTYSGPSEDVPPVSTFNFRYDTLNIPEGLSGDTIIIDVLHFFNTSAENNSPQYVRDNNRLLNRIVFANTFAYDDGSAERAYRLENFDFGKVAVGFRTSVPDTLRAISFHLPFFPNFTPGTALLPLFNIVVWSAIDTIGGDGGEELYRENLLNRNDLIQPGGSQVNDFSFYTFKPELNDGRDYLLVDGNFFVGIEFERGNGVDIGFDANTAANQHVFFNIGFGWFQSQFPGALLVNAIMGSKLSGIFTSNGPEVSTPLKQIKVYPNPAGSWLNIHPDIDLPYRYSVFNMAGQVQRFGTGSGMVQLETETLNPGMYILVLETMDGQMIGHAKWIKQ